MYIVCSRMKYVHTCLNTNASRNMCISCVVGCVHASRNMCISCVLGSAHASSNMCISCVLGSVHAGGGLTQAVHALDGAL